MVNFENHNTWSYVEIGGFLVSDQRCRELEKNSLPTFKKKGGQTANSQLFINPLSAEANLVPESRERHTLFTETGRVQSDTYRKNSTKMIVEMVEARYVLVRKGETSDTDKNRRTPHPGVHFSS